MREAHLVAQEAAKAISSDLKSLETRKVKIRDAIDASNSVFLDAKDWKGQGDDQESQSSSV